MWILSFLKQSWESFGSCQRWDGFWTIQWCGSVVLVGPVWYHWRWQLHAGKAAVSSGAVMAFLTILARLSDHSQGASALKSEPCPFCSLVITCCPFYSPCLYPSLPVSLPLMLLCEFRTTAYRFSSVLKAQILITLKLVLASHMGFEATLRTSRWFRPLRQSQCLWCIQV